MRLSGVPVFAVVNQKNEFVLVSGDDDEGRQLGLFFFAKEDAEGLIATVSPFGVTVPVQEGRRSSGGGGGTCVLGFARRCSARSQNAKRRPATCSENGRPSALPAAPSPLPPHRPSPAPPPSHPSADQGAERQAGARRPRAHHLDGLCLRVRGRAARKVGHRGRHLPLHARSFPGGAGARGGCALRAGGRLGGAAAGLERGCGRAAPRRAASCAMPRGRLFVAPLPAPPLPHAHAPPHSPTLPHTPLFFSLSRGSSTSARACPPPPSPGCRSSRPRA